MIKKDIVTIKQQEINELCEVIDSITEDCTLFATRIQGDMSFRNIDINAIDFPSEHMKLRNIMLSYNYQFSSREEFYMYFVKNDIIINSLGYVSNTRDYYDIYYKNSDMTYEEWMSNILSAYDMRFNIVDVVPKYKINREQVIYYSFPTKLYSGDDVVVVTSVRSDKYNAAVKQILGDDNTFLLVTDEQGEVCFSTENNDAALQLSERVIKNGFSEEKLNDESVVLITNRAKAAKWRYTIAIPREVFWSRLSKVITIGASAIIILFILGVGSIYFVSRDNYRVLAKLIDRIKKEVDMPLQTVNNEFALLNTFVDIYSETQSISEQQKEDVMLGKIARLMLGVGEKQNKDKLEKEMEGVFASDKFVIIVFSLSVYKHLFSEESMSKNSRYQSLVFIINNIFSELMQNYGSLHSIENGNLIFVFSPFGKTVSDIEKCVLKNSQMTVDIISENFNIDVTCGISHVYSNIENIRDCYTEAMTAITYINNNSEDSVRVYNKDMSITECYNYSREQENYLISRILNGDAEGAVAHIDTLVGADTEIKDNNIMNMLFVNVAGTIINTANNIGYKVDAEKIVNISFSDNLQEMKSYFAEIVTKMCDYVYRRGNKPQSVIVEKINSIIEANFLSPDLSVGYIANEIGMNANYISNKYREKTQLSIVDAINEKRIEYAKQLLVETNMLVETVGVKSGFGSLSNFMRIFKKLVHMTPTEFRKQNLVNPSYKNDNM